MSGEVSTVTPEATQRFSEAYRALQSAAARIEQAREDDLDTVLQVVKEALEAKRICEDRIAAAERELEKLLSTQGDPSRS